jgi:TolB-like protein/DNA-binding winged helix-turn-helix (wHTH) protein/Tfp pilus assembly protein PilF
VTDKPSEIIYSFEKFQLDPSRKLLLRLPGGDSVSLTNKAFNVLSLLVENSGKLVTKDVLMATVWEDSFVEEANLTQTISVLRKILGENPNQHRFIVTEPGKGYRFVARVRTLNGHREAGQENLGFVELPQNAGAAPGRRYRASSFFAFTGILAVFLIAAGFYLWNGNQTQSQVPSSAKGVKAIAVLPFRSIEPDQEDQLLGIGMTDAVITKLSLIESVVVRQIKSVVRYADTTPDAAKVGREINVDAVLEGNIQKANGRIRVSVRLVRVSDGSLLWAENFDEPVTDIFALQDSIAEKVAKSLSLGLNADEHAKLKHRYTENIEAYQLYTKARFFWNSRTGIDLWRSVALYEQAIAKDENYALAYASLAESYVLVQLFSQNQETHNYPKAKEAAEKALSLDPNIAEAHAALALYKQHYEWDWEGAENAFKRAISVNPNYATAHQWYGEFLALMGRTDESIVEVEKAVELDPLSLSTNTARAVPYLAAERYAEAIDKLQPALELDNTFSVALLHLGRSYQGLGDHKQAIAQYQKSIQNPGGDGPFFTTAMIDSLAKDGQRKRAEKSLNALLDLAKRHSVSNYVLARGLASLGYKEKAYDKLEKAFVQRDGLLPGLKTDGSFDEMRGEARFQEILKKMRL